MITTLVMLAALSGPVQASPDASGSNPVTLARADSAHTLFAPNAVDAGRAGQVYQLPGGGFGVSTGGTSHYQTFATPGGSGIAVPNGSNTFNFIGSGGRAGLAHIPGRQAGG
jgi:hypothetical protein